MAGTGAGYDLSVSTFSPDGRVFQVEYACKAVDSSGLCMAAHCKDGVLFLVEKPKPSPLLLPTSMRRLHAITEHIGMAIVGLAADGRQLVKRAREEATEYLRTFGVEIQAAVLADRLGLYMHAFSLYWSVRPFGAAVLIGAVTPAYSPPSSSAGSGSGGADEGRTEEEDEEAAGRRSSGRRKRDGEDREEEAKAKETDREAEEEEEEEDGVSGNKRETAKDGEEGDEDAEKKDVERQKREPEDEEMKREEQGGTRVGEGGDTQENTQTQFAGEIYCVDPSGCCSKYRATAVGKGRPSAKTELEKLDLNAATAEEALVLLLKICMRVGDDERERGGEAKHQMEAAFLSSNTQGRFALVPQEQLLQAIKTAREEIDAQEEEDEEEEEM